MTTYTVTNNNNSGAGSLRSAIAQANDNLGLDIIELAGDFELNSAISITDSLTLVGSDDTVITSTVNSRLFEIDDGEPDNQIEVSFENLTLTGGSTEEAGGAILSAEDFTITNSVLDNNYSGKSGGAIAISNGGSLKVSDSSITNNSASQRGGGISVEQNSTVEIVNTVISSNSAESGGGISSSEDTNRIEIIDSQITDNSQPNLVGDGFIFITTTEEMSLLGDTVYRFFMPSQGGHFYTTDETEKNYVIDNLSNYQYEGESYQAVHPQVESAEEVYRFFNPQTGFHLYTTDEREKEYITNYLDHFTPEGIVFHAYPTQISGSIPIYRFYEPILGTHFYTEDEAEMISVRENLTNYNYEGIAYYALPIEDSFV